MSNTTTCTGRIKRVPSDRRWPCEPGSGCRDLRAVAEGSKNCSGKGRAISSYSNKGIIFSQGHVADSVFYIKKGKVKVTVVSKQGKEAIVAILGVDEFVGEGCLIGQPRCLAQRSV